MPNSDENDTSNEADVNNSNGHGDTNALSSASTVDQSGSVTLASGPSASFGQSGFGQTSSGSSQTGGGRNNQSVTPQASTFVSPQANNVFASSPVYYTSAPHTVAFPQGFSASGSPYAQSIVHSNKPLSSPVYTQYVASSPSPYAHHSAMMQSSPTGAAQLHIATPEVLDDNAWQCASRQW
ncbi:hypothetical protein V6N12_048702 [Hibiscus sabdariffa]|uniref:Uncharacterized protein n=1 Tax=Hibiscus sabdariffa TaxID=183260 RepID=A0ABR2EI11_9ROSI